MNKNIKIESDKETRKTVYILNSSDEIKLPSFRFEIYEDAEFAIAAFKCMQIHGIDYWSNQFDIKYLFRVLGIHNGWT